MSREVFECLHSIFSLVVSLAETGFTDGNKKWLQLAGKKKVETLNDEDDNEEVIFCLFV